MTLLQIFHIGNATYIGSHTNDWNIYIGWVIIFCGWIVSAIIASKVAVKANRLSREKETIKEEDRLKSIRLLFFNLLIHWKKAMESQVEILRIVSNQIEEELKKDLPQCEPFGITVHLDICPNRLNDLKSEDIFNIIIGEKEDKKHEREILLPRLLNKMDWAIKIEKQLEENFTIDSDLHKGIADEFSTCISEIHKMAQDAHHTSKQKPLLSDPFNLGLFKIMEEYYSKHSEKIENYIKNLIYPLRDFMVIEENYKNNDSHRYLRLCQQALILYERSRTNKQVVKKRLDNWIGDIETILMTVNEIQNIEFQNETRNINTDSDLVIDSIN